MRREKKRMQQVEARTEREIVTETADYNQALHHILANAGAVLHQQENVMNEKKTVLQEAADRAELPEVVDFIGGKVGGMAVQAKNISATQNGIHERLSQLQEEIKETMALIAKLEGGSGKLNSTLTGNATATAIGGVEGR